MVHRWLVIPFVLAAIVTIFSDSSDNNVQSSAMSVVLIVSLLTLLVTGLYMFAQHYLRKLRRARSQSSP